MFKAVVGHSKDPDSLSVVEEVLQQCADFIAGDIPKTGIIFATIDLELRKINVQYVSRS
ncbi:MAG: hypothetical protein RM347_002375 [Nostoc sp. ChiQUE02]|uniref:hypothetical protein n=1 Tax=Nostoc sp. ChiQUE02 TaxID=3075377 RepID=UPI002AD4FCFA|nr:hypothetical protein [Nostoc sp. ChiQUE02]MDZ8230863.1 hypothetical protein [Nostoc sp. ChiQUE02]